ncbi:MAG: hypothetical protein ACE5JX_21015, partial [Acidobacteriota bacterium]
MFRPLIAFWLTCGLLLLFSMSGCLSDENNASGPGERETTPRFSLLRQEEFRLHDETVPIQYLHVLIALPEKADADGRFLSVDRLAQKVRMFSEKGVLTGYLQPEGVAPKAWRPESAGLEHDGRSLLVIEKGGNLWRFDLDGRRPAELLFRNWLVYRLAVSPNGRLYSLRPMPAGEIHVVEGEKFGASFLEPDENNRFLNYSTGGSVTFDEQGDLYAIRRLEGTVFHFDPAGRVKETWKVSPLYFREFRRDFNPMKSTRDREVLMAWGRTHTRFAGIEYLKGGMVAVLVANDPPAVPNTLELYNTNGKHLGGVEFDGFLVGSDGRRDLYATDKNFFFDSPPM